ncbi:uncharacterized protein BDV17DRAFT_301239 [Aspergillus undulatus]|uniref:uncharacterized protein n=1 Tax=Aspergillus undulatus TaxID=1810928 RepID=UPI003CCD3E0A
MLVSGSIQLLLVTLATTFGVPAQEIITRDVVILGGGATGTYAAVQLIERGHTVVVVERENRLGGHSDTLYLPNGWIDYGIRAYFKLPVVQNFFAQLNVDREIYVPGALRTDSINFQTGERVPYDDGLLSTALALVRYRAVLTPFDYLRSGGYYLPEPVPEVLLRPFSEFVEQYDLAGILRLLYTFSDPLGDILGTPLLYVLQTFGIAHIDALLAGPMMRPKNGSAELFRAAAAYINESNIFYESIATQATRSSSGVELVVDSAGLRRIIRASKLLITFPPLLSNFEGFDLDENEVSLFSKFMFQGYYAAVFNNSGLPDGFNIYNTDPNNQPGNLPVGRYQSMLDYPGIPGFYSTRIVGEENFTEVEARQLVLDDIRRMGDAGTFPVHEHPEIVAFESHTPSAVMVPVEDVRSGFYRKLYALQGQRSTYYTGLTFCTDFSAQLWNYTLAIVDMMTADQARVDL